MSLRSERDLLIFFYLMILADSLALFGVAIIEYKGLTL